MNEKKKMLFVVTSGADTLERTYAPFILATTVVAMGIEPIIYFLIKGIILVKREVAEKINLDVFLSLKETMDRAVDTGIKLEVCKQICSLLGLGRGDFVKEANIVGAATLNDRAMDADTVLCF